MFTVALITDTHVRPEYDDGQLAYPSDAEFNERNRQAADAIRAMSPDLVLHLGDVVHPIPSLPAHADALAVAAEIFSELGAPLAVIAGNHDVGDKTASAYAPAQVSEGRHAFQQTWGATFRSFDSGGVHFVLVDGGLLGVESGESEEQWKWLEADLDSNELRCFVFTHYPPFLADPDEPEHYDNLGVAVRDRLLTLLIDHRTEALFSGHVHRFFLNNISGVDLVSLPSATFSRPEYSALRPAPPADAENGRDDREHLGVTRMTISESGYRLDINKLHSRAPGPPSPQRALGVWLRHRLGRRAELPYGDLDALTRKTARDEASLVQVLDLGFSHVRVPLADLDDPDVRFRLGWLARHGVGTLVFSGGLPNPRQRETFERHGADAQWEVVLRDADLDNLIDLLPNWMGPGFTVGRIGKVVHPDSRYFSHFPREGFDPAHPALEALAKEGVTGVAFRVAAEGSVDAQVQAAVECAAQLGVRATCHVELPFNSEALPQTDDELVVERVLAADRAASAYDGALVMIDMLVDKEHGYWCRHGLVDSADQPRAAYRALKASTTTT